jgi:hypothetical protein
MAETPFVPPKSTAYSPVFTLVRDWLGLAGLGADAPVLDSLARNIAADMCERDLAPAAYGDKRRPYYTHASAGLEGMSATLHLRDGSLELVFKDEELDLVREEGDDLHVAHIEASEVLALRQWLIDFLPASEAEIRPVTVAQTLAETANGLADLYVQRVSEWDDRTSPQDWPEALLITGTELKAELLRFAHEAAALATGGARG